MTDISNISIEPDSALSVGEDTLLPCPFCGGAARFIGGKPSSTSDDSAHVYSVSWQVKCRECYAESMTVLQDGDNPHGAQLFAAVAWNKRTPEAQKEDVT